MSDASRALQPAGAGPSTIDGAVRFATRNARVLAPLLTLIVLVLFFWFTTDTFMLSLIHL